MLLKIRGEMQLFTLNVNNTLIERKKGEGEIERERDSKESTTLPFLTSLCANFKFIAVEPT